MKEDYSPINFDEFVDKINGLLDRIKIKRHSDKAFEIYEKNPEKKINATDISSGEAELISLGIEFLIFVEESKSRRVEESKIEYVRFVEKLEEETKELSKNDRPNIIFVDEPDVHLHPDLQNRLADFIVSVLEDDSIILVIATHSTALLAGLSASPLTPIID